MVEKNGTDPQVTPGSLWRKPREEGIVVTLPSGNIARLRPVALDVMIKSGKLPDFLTPIAAKTLWTGMEAEDIGDVAELATGMAELFGTVCKASFIEPKIVDEEQEPKADDEISLEDIDFQDKAFVFQLATQPAEVLRKFRDRQDADMATLPADESDKPKAKPDRRN